MAFKLAWIAQVHRRETLTEVVANAGLRESVLRIVRLIAGTANRRT